MNKRIVWVAAALATGAVNGLAAVAGPYTDDLSKCIVEATTASDRASFVRWMFAAATQHPAVKSLATVSPEQLEAENKLTAGLFMRLLTESCRDQTAKAVKYEGPTAIASGFQILGQVAGQELFSSPEVTAALSGMEKYFDKEKLQAVGGESIRDETTDNAAPK